jgi:hypothetical protein
MYYNEAYEARQTEEQALLTKWEKALNIDGGIKDEHLARTTAICLENYLNYLHENPALIAEDRVQAGNFTGVNLALLGLIARVVPNLVGAELVGVQAMPTPKSPIFTLRWYKDTAKGQTTNHEEMWVTPVPQDGVGLDPWYSSQIVMENVAPAATEKTMVFGNAIDNMAKNKPFIFGDSMYLTGYDAAGNVMADYLIRGTYLDSSITPVKLMAAGLTLTISAWDFSARKLSFTALPADDGGSPAVPVEKYVLRYEYKQEAEPNMPEISFEITDATVDLIRRQLRGKYTLDAAFDLKKYHGINIDTELGNMMKVELQAEINREIVSDLRMLAGITKTFDYKQFLTDANLTNHNYDDAHKALLDAVNILCAEIHVQGRLGRGNFLVSNPATMAFLDRVPGFVGSGVSYNGKELSFAGTIGGKIKVYFDPLFPKNEFLIGYKGPGALDCGYIHAPYLPITATPTLINPETGDPSKLFYTRYGKTFYVKSVRYNTPTNLILNGQYQYARMLIVNYPANALQW